jgi:hypothetical protein
MQAPATPCFPARPSTASPSRLEQLVVTNTIPLREAAQKLSKIKVLSIAGLLGAAIESIHMETSVSTLFSRDQGLRDQRSVTRIDHKASAGDSGRVSKVFQDP